MDAENDVIFQKVKLDFANSVSSSTTSSIDYLQEEKVNFKKLVLEGLESIDKATTKVSEKSNKAQIPVKNIYFRRVVLAGEIAKILYDEPTFGHVKFQKLVFLCEKVCKYNLRHRYVKQAAGPMDVKFMHSIDKEFQRQNWFSITREGEYNKCTYRPLPDLKKHQSYYDKYFHGNDDKIHWILETFRKHRTRDVELVATIFASWEELHNQNEQFSQEKIISKVYGWSKEKKKFSRNEIIESINFMLECNLYPQAHI